MTTKHAEYLKTIEIVLNRLDDNIANSLDLCKGLEAADKIASELNDLLEEIRKKDKQERRILK